MKTFHPILVGLLVVLIGLRLSVFTPNNDTNSNQKIYYDMGKEDGFFPQLRGYLSDQIANQYPPLPAQLLGGYLLGRDDFDRNFKDSLISTGTIHVVVVSGFNITLVASTILTTSVWLGRKKALLLSLIGIMAYTFLSGAEPPTIRAAIMGSLAFGAQAFGRQKDGKDILILTGLVMILIDPRLITDLSFQLSLLATLGIIEFSPWLTTKLHRLGPVRGDLATTLAAQSLVIPLLFFHFGQLSLISVLVNLLVLWTVPLATILGFVSLFVGWLLPPLGQLLAWGNYLFLAYFILVVDLFKDFPLLPIEKGNWFFLVGYYFVLVGVVFWVKNYETNRKTV